jgi:hypothetical protein
MTFDPKHPSEIIAEAINRFGADLSQVVVREQICQFILSCLSDMELTGRMARVPWCVSVSLSPLGVIEFLVLPDSLKNRATRYVQEASIHVIVDVDTGVTTEATDLFVGLTQHARDVEQYLNAHYRN